MGLELVEVSFEVANKVGGIHQVLNSKSYKMKEYYGEKYLTIGFYDQKQASQEFVPLENVEYFEIFEKLKSEGINCYYGEWSIDERPKTILVDASGLKKEVDDIKKEYWELHGIDTLEAGHDVDEPLKWSYAAGRLVQELEKDHDFVLHLHEWLSGPAAFETESPTVFTTHATVLGRALSNSGYDLVKMIEEDNISEDLAKKHGVNAKHTIEKASAREAEVFTTVSKTTASEAEKILGVRPDKVLPNGFNVKHYPSLKELSYNHTEKKKKVKQFLKAYFRPYYEIDLENDPRIFFASGRYEFHNKGFDLLIDALDKVNQGSGDDIYVFFFVPSDVKRPKPEVMENKKAYASIKHEFEALIPEMKKEFIEAATSGRESIESIETVLEESERLKSLQSKFHSREGRPPVSAFELNYGCDDIVQSLYEAGLDNSEDNRVKVVFYPTYLSEDDGLLSMDYEDAVVAASAGFFPSYYEPWGYTPVETAANGVLSVTSDLAGFGRFLLNNADDADRKGIKVLERRSVSRERQVEDLANIIEEFSSYDKAEITERKHNARKLAQITSWDKLGHNYKEAHKMAREK